MSICDALEGWDDASPEDRFEQMKEWAQEFAEEWGLDPPNVVNENAVNANGDSSLAGYDPDSNTIYLGPDLFGGEYSPEFVTGEAAHETRHAMQWQYYGEWTPYEMPRSAREADAQDFGDSVRDYAEDECDDGSDSEPEDPDADEDEDWELVEEDGGEDESGQEEDGERPPRPKPNPDEEDPIA